MPLFIWQFSHLKTRKKKGPVDTSTQTLVMNVRVKQSYTQATKKKADVNNTLRKERTDPCAFGLRIKLQVNMAANLDFFVQLGLFEN